MEARVPHRSEIMSLVEPTEMLLVSLTAANGEADCVVFTVIQGGGIGRESDGGDESIIAPKNAQLSDNTRPPQGDEAAELASPHL